MFLKFLPVVIFMLFASCGKEDLSSLGGGSADRSSADSTDSDEGTTQIGIQNLKVLDANGQNLGTLLHYEIGYLSILTDEGFIFRLDSLGYFRNPYRFSPRYDSELNISNPIYYTSRLSDGMWWEETNAIGLKKASSDPINLMAIENNNVLFISPGQDYTEEKITGKSTACIHRTAVSESGRGDGVYVESFDYDYYTGMSDVAPDPGTINAWVFDECYYINESGFRELVGLPSSAIVAPFTFVAE